MTDAIGDIIGNKVPKEPIEFQVIRSYVQDRFSLTPSLQLQNNQIIIGLPHAAAASSLQLELQALQNILNTDKTLRIRIGQ